MSERNKLLRVSTFEAEASFDFVRLCLGITASVNLLFGTRALSSGLLKQFAVELEFVASRTLSMISETLTHMYVCMPARNAHTNVVAVVILEAGVVSLGGRWHTCLSSVHLLNQARGLLGWDW